MFWLMDIVVAAVVFGTAAVAAGVGGTLGAVAPDPRPLAAAAGPLTPADLAEVRFPVVLRGYRMDAVDAVLDRVGEELALRDARIRELESAGEPVGESAENRTEP